jgi:UDP-glucose 4-epimerase
MENFTQLKGKKILVTGGAGFIGSNLVDKLVRMGAKVTVLDDLFTGDTANIDELDEINFVRGSVTDAFLVNELVSKADIVFHVACRNIIVSTKNPFDDFQVNVGGTYNILLASKNHNIEKVVYTSSASVYGNALYIPIHEEEGLRPLNPYAASKLSAENYCIAYYESFDLPVTIVRYSNVYGIKQSPTNPYCGVISKFLDAIEKGIRPKIHGDGEQTRDFTYIDDAVSATILAAISPKTVGEVFNLGSGKETSVINLARTVIAIANGHIGDMEPEYIDRRDIDNVRRRVLNIEKIRKTLHWVPKTSLESGIEMTHQWFTENDQSLYNAKYKNIS